jgi:hypothetical protein
MWRAKVEEHKSNLTNQVIIYIVGKATYIYVSTLYVVCQQKLGRKIVEQIFNYSVAFL